MAMATTPDLSTEVNTILDTAMRDFGITTETALAGKLGVTPTAIYKWRRGKLSPSSRALLPLLIQQYQIDLSKPRRRRKSDS
jgi:transcriptional regulator with XRE-family HTH domain